MQKSVNIFKGTQGYNIAIMYVYAVYKSVNILEAKTPET